MTSKHASPGGRAIAARSPGYTLPDEPACEVYRIIIGGVAPAAVVVVITAIELAVADILQGELRVLPRQLGRLQHIATAVRAAVGAAIE